MTSQATFPNPVVRQPLPAQRRSRARLVALAFIAALVVLPPSVATAQDGAETPSRLQYPLCPAGLAEQSSFSDLSVGETHAANVECLVHYGITQGTGEGEFSPQSQITRAQMASFMKRALLATRVVDLPVVANHAGFDDIDGWPSNLQENMIQMTAMSPPVISPASADSFGPSDVVNRAEMARILAAFLHHTAPTISQAQSGGEIFVAFDNRPSSATAAPESGFGDLADESVATRRAVDALAHLGIARGTSETEFAPSRPVSRAQMASFVVRSLSLPAVSVNSKATDKLSITALSIHNARIADYFTSGGTQLRPEGERAEWVVNNFGISPQCDSLRTEWWMCPNGWDDAPSYEKYADPATYLRSTCLSSPEVFKSIWASQYSMAGFYDIVTRESDFTDWPEIFPQDFVKQFTQAQVCGLGYLRSGNRYQTFEEFHMTNVLGLGAVDAEKDRRACVIATEIGVRYTDAWVDSDVTFLCSEWYISQP